jgi:hypothetical protein
MTVASNERASESTANSAAKLKAPGVTIRLVQVEAMEDMLLCDSGPFGPVASRRRALL